MSAPGIAARESAAPAAHGAFDAEADVVVVGGGGGGLPAALFARWQGDEVILLEKAPELGGTARKAAFWYWVPNNAPMRAAGTEDREEDFLRYVARLSRPKLYDPDSPTFGLSEWEHVALPRDLRERAARPPSCWPSAARCPTATAPPCPTTGPSCPRTRRRPAACSCPRARARRCPTAARSASARWREAARRDGVDIRTGHRVQRARRRRRRGRRRRGRARPAPARCASARARR